LRVSAFTSGHDRIDTYPVGAHALCADAIDEAGAAFYRAHQFRRFASRPPNPYLPLKTAAALFAASRKEKP
jgi:hypothetical protein